MQLTIPETQDLHIVYFFIYILAAAPLASRGCAPKGKLKNVEHVVLHQIVGIICINKKIDGEFFYFWGSWGYPTPQENSLKPPQDH